MCGIAGVMYADPARPVDRAALHGMAESLAHRGPDAEGFWVDSGVGLAHRRLAIIDLEGGNQPMGNEDGSVQIVFNGEIYNFQELRAVLEAKGHRFRTRTDTEVLVHLYEEEGEKLVERLRGMFAFALWDRRQRRLLLARDRLGLKPMYIFHDSEKLIFASELKAILVHPGVDRAVDPAGLDAYLTYGVIPGAKSIFRSIRKLEPGHVLSVSARQFDGSPRRYWQLCLEPDGFRSLEEWNEALLDKIVQTIRLHRIADVPVGAFLSGGLDSSVVVATLAEISDAPVRTFSIGFVEDRFSELSHARHIARQYGGAHVEEIVTPEAVGSLEELVRAYDEPFADPSAIPTLCISRLARQSVKVVLSGDGGDEAFGGYTRYGHDLREAALRAWIPRWARRLVLGLLARCCPKADWLPRVLRAKTRLTNLSLDPAEAYANTLAICRHAMRRRLLHADVVRELNGSFADRIVAELYATAPTRDPLAGMIAADVGMLLPDDFLTKIDRASMAYGLEVRPPLVDHELVELAARIPSCWKVHKGETKWILKQLFQDRLPAQTVWRAKHGFEVPIDDWLRGPLRDMFESTALAAGNPASSLINQSVARKLLRAHRARLGQHGPVLWALLVLSRWAEKNLTPPRTPAPQIPRSVMEPTADRSPSPHSAASVIG